MIFYQFYYVKLSKIKVMMQKIKYCRLVV